MQKLRLFVVDDDSSVLRSSVRILGREHDVTSSADARVLLELLRAGREFDAVLSDVEMPGMSGKDLFDALQSEFPAYARRIVFLTGGAQDDVLSYLRSKAVVLDKPVNPSKLLQTVKDTAADRMFNDP